MGKPVYQRCGHLCATGCGIYPTQGEPDPRPRACGVFRCVWLQAETMPDTDRPDRLGAFFAVDDTPVDVQTEQGPARVPLVHVWEAQPGGAALPRVRAYLRALTQQMGCAYTVHRMPAGGPSYGDAIEETAAADQPGTGGRAPQAA